MTYHELFIKLPRIFFYFIRNQKKTFCVQKKTFCVRNIFLLILTVIITERFNIHFSRITWLVAILYSLLDCAPNFINAPLLFLLTLGQKIRNCYPLQNIFQTFDMEHRKLLFSSFNLENILSSLALETGTMNNNLIINSKSLQLLVLGAAKVLRHWLDTKLWREKQSSSHILQIRTSVPKDRKRISHQRPATLLKKRLWHRRFPVNFPKFLRTPFLTEHLWWLLLDISVSVKNYLFICLFIYYLFLLISSEKGFFWVIFTEIDYLDL